MNPYTPPTAPLEQGAAVGPINPQRAAEIQKELSGLNAKSFALAIPGFVLQIVARNFTGVMSIGLSLLGTALFIGGLVFYARMRGRHPAFSLLGLVSCLGLLILYFLPKSCLNCGQSHGFSVKQCTRCGGPLGA
jgi:hypothetical protein